MDYDIARHARLCETTGRELKAGDVFYSTLTLDGSRVVRHDYAEEAWQGPPEGVLGWWKSQVPTASTKKMQWAPNDVMLQLLEELAAQPERHDMRYVLSLLLVRRRVLRMEEVENAGQGGEVSVLYCPRRDTTYRVATVIPDAERTAQIQEELASLLVAQAV